MTGGTMGDFRDRVYERYVSTFKEPVQAPGGRGFHAWCEDNYLPLLAGLSSDARILELGCGAGQLLAFLRAAGFTDVSGVDLSAEQVDIAQRRGLTAHVQDARDTLREVEEELDAVMAIDFLEHFSIEEIFGLLEQVLDTLVPGGRLIMRTPNGGAMLGGHVIYGDLSHLTIFSPGSLRQTLGLAGFGEIVIHACPPSRGTFVGSVRAGLWKGIEAGATLLYLIETGKKQSIWTESMLCACRSPLTTSTRDLSRRRSER